MLSHAVKLTNFRFMISRCKYHNPRRCTFNLHRTQQISTSTKDNSKQQFSTASAMPIKDYATSEAENLHNNQRKLVDLLNSIPKKIEQFNYELGFDQETNIIAKKNNSGLFINQIEMEKTQLFDAQQSYQDTSASLIKMGRGTGLGLVQKLMVSWFPALNQEVIKETKSIETAVSGKDRLGYGPCLLLLPADKFVLILLDTVINEILKSSNKNVRVRTLANIIGEAVESEVYAVKLKLGKAAIPIWQQELAMKVINQNKGRKGKGLNIRLTRLIDEEKWHRDLKVKLGAALLSILIRTAKCEDGTLAFSHVVTAALTPGKKCGYIEMNEAVYDSISPKDTSISLPRYLPMLIPPKKWNNKRNNGLGCYWLLKANLMRTYSNNQLRALSNANMEKVLAGLNYLGNVPWRINKKVLHVVQEAWEQKLLVGELPNQNDYPLPEMESCIRIPQPNKYSVAQSSLPLLDSQLPTFDEKYYKSMCRKVATKNGELHSLRCDMKIKLRIAELFKEDKIYYPYSLDFRGRAYPVPPNLNHLGSDLCRGLLLFHEAKPLGKYGLSWLKVHLANLFGHNKIDHQKREEWVNERIQYIYDSVKNPLSGSMWWATAEEPFQALATSYEIVAAIESGDHESYMCRLPVHQDGSCNGLQHYAALGKDQAGAAAVNLLPADEPQDVYSKVLDIVVSKIKDDCLISAEEIQGNKEKSHRQKCARLVDGHVNRKVIKQTVMTSVYGVTRTGARQQVQSKLAEKLCSDALITPEMDTEIFHCSRYVADLTLDSLREMFYSARMIMDWLSACAGLLAGYGESVNWITPLGLPVMQPYRKSESYVVSTLLQDIILAHNSDDLPVSTARQKSALPPNFVHSLDATHMLMTCLKMKDKKLTFASVHDSYWTHPCDVETMNEALREAFVELYEMPILDNFRESLTERFPHIEFPPLPIRGRLDLQQVKSSKYFFH